MPVKKDIACSFLDGFSTDQTVQFYRSSLDSLFSCFIHSNKCWVSFGSQSIFVGNLVHLDFPLFPFSCKIISSILSVCVNTDMWLWAPIRVVLSGTQQTISLCILYVQFRHRRREWESVCERERDLKRDRERKNQSEWERETRRKRKREERKHGQQRNKFFC